MPDNERDLLPLPDRIAGNRCAIDFDSWNLPISRDEALCLLVRKGFKVVDADIVALANSFVGNAPYRRGARIREAPYVFDCSSFIKWLFAQQGIWLPRRSIQQREYGRRIVYRDNMEPGDVIFVSGAIDYYLDDPADGVGHVGILVENEMVIHAANKKSGIVKTMLETFTSEGKFRGTRRYIDSDEKLVTLQVPPEREIESGGDIKWILLQSLPR